MKKLFLSLLLLLVCVPLVSAQQVPVKEVVLDNGMRVLMVPRKGDPNVAVGWIARVGSVNERPGITGISHLFEHMMFKGTHTIGTKDYAQDKKIMDQMDMVWGRIQEEQQALIRKQRLGEIPDAKDPSARSPKYQELLQELSKLEQQQKDLMVKDEFDKVYTTAGGSGMNAGTTADFTIYFINVPANKLELWFWMESDRLLNPVFREFYSERDVVHEERRLRTDSTPTGKFEEELDAMFWESSPYSWPVVGWPSDLEAITRQEALDYFGVNYAPNNLTACLVGDFDPANAAALAKKYFGRIPRGAHDPGTVRTQEVKQLAEKRMVASAETSPQVAIRYHTVLDGHTDDFALGLMADLLNGRTGRLQKSLVLKQNVATSAFASQDGRRFEGLFELRGVAKPGHTPEEVEQALYKEIERLQKEPVGAEELQKVKNQNAANSFRRLQSSFALMFQLLIADSGRGWQTLNTDPARLQAVTADDIKRVASTYFAPENRTVAIYYTKKGAATEEDPLMAGLNDQEKQFFRQVKAQVGQANAEQLKGMLARIEQQSANVPAEQQKIFAAIKKLIEEQLKKLGGGK